MQGLWSSASLDEYAAFEGALGQHTVNQSGVYWLRVRPFFYRPVLPLVAFAPNSIRPPASALLGAFQHAVPSGAKSNSFLNFLLFENAQTYSADTLDYNRKRQIKLASKQFRIRRITDVTEFKEHAYSVYLSFLDRTGYQHGTRRKDHGYFCRWADLLFRLPNLAVLGGFREGTLGAVSLSFLIEDTVAYSTFFCDTVSMKFHIADLMLHFVREAAASQRARQIFVGMRKFGAPGSVDDFYLIRGCKLITKPALFRANPLARLFLISFLPKQYLQLLGDSGSKEV